VRSLVLGTLVLSALATAPAQAQQPVAYVVKLGGDTLSLEQFTRTSQQVRGEFVVRTPRSLYRRYTMDLHPDGTVRRFEMTTRTLGGASQPSSRMTIEFTGDSAIMTMPRGDSSVTTRIAARRGAVPSLNGVMGIMDQLAHQYRAAARDTYAVDLVPPGATQAMRSTLTRAGGGKLRLSVVTSVGRIPPFTLDLDEQGGLEAFNGRGSVFQADAERVRSVDMAAATAQFEHRPLGALSARDTVRAMLGRAALWVDYGRPHKRGREIFGGVVPWNEVWRTGANAATQFHTPVDLTIGGADVPAGTYTLWTLPTPTGWKLIINRQIGQWGTLYDPSRDLARVDLTVETLPEPEELFTIDIVPQGDGASLRFAWDRTRAFVPVKVKS
jgi:hypothetical protein